ncbi:MAG: SDR family NAD(P)-dependent oxidoreductase [Deltaproteobacteria bacterium]|nr:SDR family NAD(P)-dependent oxidoreductase [Deltaproteobacteria bacterium]MBW2361942.1 SDR family NAD(P)-dependent oxidoreductase [Deltaproteobacteria bacterium]
MEELRDRTAVVTGAASGIGLALSQRFAAEGMRVVLADIEAEPLESARRALADSGAEAIAVQTDVTQPDQLSALAQASVDAFGAVHVLCNNAGVFTAGASWQVPRSDYEWVFNVNIWGVIHGIQAFVPIMLEQDEPAHVVNTASMAGVTRAPMASAYYMSKHAVLSLSETLYLELENGPVGVSVLCPEVINTRIGSADRNRPPHLKRGELDDPSTFELVESALKQATAQGLDPSVMAERVVEAIHDNQLYILSEAGGAWRAACDARLEDLRLARNPSGPALALGN